MSQPVRGVEAWKYRRMLSNETSEFFLTCRLGKVLWPVETPPLFIKLQQRDHLITNSGSRQSRKGIQSRVASPVLDIPNEIHGHMEIAHCFKWESPDEEGSDRDILGSQLQRLFGFLAIISFVDSGEHRVGTRLNPKKHHLASSLCHQIHQLFVHGIHPAGAGPRETHVVLDDAVAKFFYPSLAQCECFIIEEYSFL